MSATKIALTVALLVAAFAAAAGALADADPACSASPDGTPPTTPSRLALAGHLAATPAIEHGFEYGVVRGLRLAGGRLFHLESPAPGLTQLRVRDRVDGTDRPLVGPQAFPLPPRSTLAWYAPSPDGTKVAFGTTSLPVSNKVPGTSQLRVVDVASGLPGPDNLGGATRPDLAWLPDGTGFFRGRSDGATPDVRVLLHRLGTDEVADVPLVGAGVQGSPPMTAGDTPMLMTTSGSTFAVLAIFHGAEDWPTLYIAPLRAAIKPGAPWRSIASPDDHVTDFALRGDRLFLLLHGNEPGSRVLELDARKPALAHARVVVPAGPRVIRRVVMASDALYLFERCVTKARIGRLDLASREVRDVDLPLAGYIDVVEADAAAPGLVFKEDNWTTLAQFYRTPGSGEAVIVPLLPAPAASTPAAEPPRHSPERYHRSRLGRSIWSH